MLWRYDAEQKGELSYYIFQQTFVDNSNPDGNTEGDGNVYLDKSVRVHDVYVTDLQERTYIFIMNAFRATRRDLRSLSDDSIPRLLSRTRPSPYSNLLAQINENTDLPITTTADTIPGKWVITTDFKALPKVSSLYKHHNKYVAIYAYLLYQCVQVHLFQFAERQQGGYSQKHLTVF